MREGAECLCPNDTEITDTPEAGKLGEYAIEYIAQQVAGEACYDGLAALITRALSDQLPATRGSGDGVGGGLQTIRNITESE